MVWGINLLLVTWTRVILWPQQLSDHGHREPPSPSRRATKIIGSEAAGRTQTESLRQHKQSVVEWNLMSTFLYLFLSCLVSDFIFYIFLPYSFRQAAILLSHDFLAFHKPLQCADAEYWFGFCFHCLRWMGYPESGVWGTPGRALDGLAESSWKSRGQEGRLWIDI